MDAFLSSKIGVKSPPPPNQIFFLSPSPVTNNRVFMCAAGTNGLHMCDTTDIPDAQNFPFSSAPGI